MMTDRLPRTLLLLTLLIVVGTAGCGEDQQAGEEEMMGEETTTQDMDGMPAMEAVPDSLRQADLAPLVPAYYEDGEAFFIHTEASNETVAEMLTEMMGPEVLYVSELADTPEPLVTVLYVFENGVEGIGPFGYQRDVLTTVPGDGEYRPFAEIYRISWNGEAEPEVLRSVQAIQNASSEGLISIEATGDIVNAPVLVWPDGHR